MGSSSASTAIRPCPADETGSGPERASESTLERPQWSSRKTTVTSCPNTSNRRHHHSLRRPSGGGPAGGWEMIVGRIPLMRVQSSQVQHEFG
ncbi:MAG: hypothetical protein ACJA07_001468 [Rhodococcus sp. (in: high G+C Gram-positive bacteria)]|jgi:hypothetical protein